jgi:RHS repeat-associated protein
LSTFYAVGVTAGFSTGALGIGGGVTGSAADTRQRASWVDLNADGLLDQITNFFLDDIKVRFGTGAGLTEEVTWKNFHRYQLKLPFEVDISISDEIAVDTTVGLGAGFDFTYGIGPLCAPVPACYVIVGVGANVEESISRQTIDLQDINGDGYMDHLSSDKGDAIKVALNPTGNSNLLRKITNPIGGSIELEYQRKGNTTEQPFSQKVLSQVKVNDGYSWGAECASTDDCRGDGPDSKLTTYEYSENPFDHLERAPLGYGTVIERHHDTSVVTANDVLPPVIRSWERHYRNASVFDVGLMESEVLRGPDGPFSETRKIWNLLDIDTGLEADLSSDPSGVAALEMSVHPQLSRTEQEWFENNISARETSWDFSYDTLGNVTRILDAGEPGDEDDMIVRIGYSQCAGSSWVNLPDEFEVKLLDGTLLRKRWAEQLCGNNSLTQLSEDTGNGVAVTDLVYDFFGNYADITYPENENGQRYRVVYEYDAPRWTNVANVTDSFGLSSYATYHGATGQLASRMDSNGQSTNLSFDPQGRVVSLTSPYEQATANVTVEFDYHPQTAQYSWARARHFNAFNPTDTVDTVQFVDGMARQTQTKQDASVFDESSGLSSDVMVVSGARKFDALDRIVAEWHPSTEPLGSTGVFKLEPDTEAPTVRAWTFFEELKQIIEPHGAVTTWHYSFRKPTAETGEMLVAERVDALGKTTRTFTNMAGYVEFSERDYDDVGSATVLQTAVLWDSLDQFIGLTDPAGNETTHTLDLLGRRIGSETPDGGLVTYEFDTASQLIRKTTPEIRATGTEISYRYDHNRLIGIDYPDDTPDVSYQFGALGAPDNGVGRIVALDDGTRMQQLKYGKMGERVEETTTVRTHNYPGQESSDNKPSRKEVQYPVWTTRWAFDSWGRLKNIAYPDGESVVYEYDSGGLVKSVTGSKAGHQYRYVDEQAYDEFAMRRYQRTGNGVETITRYEADSRRLKGHVTNAPARDVQNITYEYDLGGNILSIQNTAPTPKPNLMGGTSHHDYQYDDLHRLVSASGSYEFGANKRREYNYVLDYDLLGNIEKKSQQDFVGKGNKLNPVHSTTYTLDYVYGSTAHQASRVGNRSYSYDENGNFTGWVDDGNSKRRSLQWDAENRVRVIREQGSTTEYQYNDESALTVARGPGGETIFVNKFYTVRNTTVAWKHIWAGSEQISTKREKSGRVFEHEQFLLHKDLRGNIRIVTDTDGKIYEYLEYFPGGESWVLEHSNTDRVPYRFIGGYFDEDRETYNLGYRWYEPRDQVFLSQDPVLQDSPADAIFSPDLMAAYTYGDNNPLRLLDHDGRAPSNAFIHHLQKRYLGADETFTPAEVAHIRSAVLKNSAFADEFLSKPTTFKGRLGNYIADQKTQRRLVKAKWQVPSVFKVKISKSGKVRSIRLFNKKKTFKRKKQAKK